MKDKTVISNAMLKVLHTDIQANSDDEGVFLIESLLHLPFTISLMAKGICKRGYHHQWHR